MSREIVQPGTIEINWSAGDGIDCYGERVEFQPGESLDVLRERVHSAVSRVMANLRFYQLGAEQNKKMNEAEFQLLKDHLESKPKSPPGP